MSRRMINIKEETALRIENECKAEFLGYHPQLKDYYMSFDFMLNKMIDFYLK